MWAQTFTTITQDEIDIILHSRKTFLFSEKESWVKQTDDNFDVPMGGYDLLVRINTDRLRKQLIQVFRKNQLQITVECNVKIVDFLDVKLNLINNTYRPYRKEIHKINYVHKHSCHPPAVTKQLPLMIQNRLNILSSNETMFKAEKDIYEDALKNSGYSDKMNFIANENKRLTNKNVRNRKRNTVWFNPPFNTSVSTNIGREFLKLVDIHFSESSGLHKFFNRSNIKVSYSCMPNLSSIISSHNKRILGVSENENAEKCNCNDNTKCPLPGKCQTESIVYKAEVEAEGSTRNYIGMTANSFKRRYYIHNNSFNNRGANSTGLSKYIWELKDKNKTFELAWSIQAKAPSFTPETNKCYLCLTEKVLILKSEKRTSLNKRHEIFSKCCHRRGTLLGRLL